MKLGQKVKCYGYLKKKSLPYIIANQEDEHIEDIENNLIKLSFAEGINLELYEIVEKEFKGICVGVTPRSTKREYTSDTDGEKTYIVTNAIDYKNIAKVYYGNCKSRLVPLSLLIEDKEREKSDE